MESKLIQDYLDEGYDRWKDDQFKCSYCGKMCSDEFNIMDGETLTEHIICKECHNNIYRIDDFNLEIETNGKRN